jgi:hypothetical protein
MAGIDSVAPGSFAGAFWFPGGSSRYPPTHELDVV